MSNKYRDFDSAWAEKKSEPVTFTAGGKAYTLPPSVPFAFVLEANRLEKDHGTGYVPEASDLAALLPSLLGDEQYRQLVQDVDTAQLVDILAWIYETYGLAAKSEEDADPNASAPQGAVGQ